MDSGKLQIGKGRLITIHQSFHSKLTSPGGVSPALLVRRCRAERRSGVTSTRRGVNGGVMLS